eukprot:gnl/TRDRNA2_/TRDRNA2_35401_c0_seq1.p1 gnl/TRDRNA2_/TRDRNA2_35401_c0~~gnl/TRDRNA2_/TRDRNA2_35401_c0_seq1.p1  ORF type:complete len:306 (+),score=65.40 gnl/TRDRNA2_/TRDRNA2_35401_c0_seq1:58-975(+)
MHSSLFRSIGGVAARAAQTARPSMVPALARAFSTAQMRDDPSKVRVNHFKAAIKPCPGQKRQIGLWTGLRSTLVAEMISHVSGMDWFVIDMEHGPNEINDVLVQLQASQRGGAEPVVRVPWNEIVTVKRVLDLGAQSILFPWVNSAAEAQAAVDAMRYPREGVRGVMSLARMNNYGASNPHYYKEAANQLCTIVQIETVEAVDNIEEIAAVDGVDALFIGPSDLSASMGHIGNPGHPEVRAKIEEAIKRIAKTGKASGFLSGNHDDCRWVLSLGCNFCAVGSDMNFLTGMTKKAAEDFHKYCETL